MIRPIFGTMRFDMPGDSDYIPAIPTTTAARKDPTVRDNVMSPRDPDIPDWRKRWQFNRETGLLESPFMLAWIDAAEFNEFLGKAWKSHGKDTVKGVLLYMDQNSQLFDDCLSMLLHFKFERRGDLELSARRYQLVFVGPAAKWKAKGETDE